MGTRLKIPAGWLRAGALVLFGVGTVLGGPSACSRAMVNSGSDAAAKDAQAKDSQAKGEALADAPAADSLPDQGIGDAPVDQSLVDARPYSGPHYLRQEVPSFSTISRDPVDIPQATLSFTPANVDEGWVIFFSGEMLSSSVSESSLQVSYQLNGVEHGIVSMGNMQPDNSLPLFQVDALQGVTSQQTVTLQLEAISGEATVRNLEIVAFPLPADNDLQIKDMAGVHEVGGSWSTVGTLSFTPRAAGDYLLVATLSLNEKPTTSSVWVRLKDTSGSYWPAKALGNHRHNWLPQLMARVQTLDPVSQSFELQGESGDTSSQVANARIFAFRLDGFDDVQSVEDLQETSTNDEELVKSSLQTRTPPGLSDYIVIQSMGLAVPDKDPSLLRGRSSWFRRDGQDLVSFRRYNDADGPTSSVVCLRAFTSDESMLLENVFGTDYPNLPVNSFESVIHVLRLP